MLLFVAAADLVFVARLDVEALLLFVAAADLVFVARLDVEALLLFVAAALAFGEFVAAFELAAVASPMKKQANNKARKKKLDIGELQ